MSSQIPENLRYAKSHEWARLEGDTVVVGISDHAQSQLGDVVYVELPALDEEYARGATMGVIESVKATSDLYAPMSGKVVEVNEALSDDPAVINRDPYGQGWIARLQVSDPSEWDLLLDAAAYAQLLAEEGGH